MRRWLFFLFIQFGLGQVFAGQLTGITPEELQQLRNQGALLVDIRTEEEWRATGLVPGSQKLTFFDASGHYDKDAWLKQLKFLLKSSDQPLVLICRSGSRSSTVGKMLVDEAGFGKVFHLEKGIRAWSAEGLPLN